MPITGKKPHGLATESRCTVSCAPYKMPEEILGWSLTRNVTRPSSAYGNSTRNMRKVDHRHPAAGGGTCAMQSRYFAQRFLKKQPERRLGECPAGVRDHCSQSREPSHRGWPAQPSSDRPQGLYAHHKTLEKARLGYPLGGGHPERVPQEFYDSFHSAREDQSDTASDSNSETEDWDDIVAYDTETSRYTMVANRECRRACNHHRTNKRQHRE